MLAAKGVCQKCGYAHGAHRTDCPRIRGSTGYIYRVEVDRGFGFIKLRGRDEELYFHANDLAGGLEFGPQLQEMYVRFEIVSDGMRGRRAVKVRPGD
jgi:cold shock CspA family protein